MANDDNDVTRREFLAAGGAVIAGYWTARTASQQPIFGYGGKQVTTSPSLSSGSTSGSSPDSDSDSGSTTESDSTDDPEFGLQGYGSYDYGS